MSKEAVEQVLGRIVADQEFRQLFFSNPEEALKPYDLAAEEREALQATNAGDVEAFSRKLDVEGFSRKLDERITKGKMLH